MKKTTAGKIADATDDRHIGKTVTFADFHGRTVTGTLEYATCPPSAMYALISVSGTHDRAVFRNTIVEVA